MLNLATSHLKNGHVIWEYCKLEYISRKGNVMTLSSSHVKLPERFLQVLL